MEEFRRCTRGWSILTLSVAVSAVALAAVLFSAASALAQGTPRDETAAAINELSGEMLECSTYFLISSECIANHPGLSRQDKEMADRMTALAMATGGAVGVTDAAVQARGRLMAADLLKQMEGNCVNIAILLERYSNFCNKLRENADPRLIELKEGKKCTGTYRCR